MNVMWVSLFCAVWGAIYFIKRTPTYPKENGIKEEVKPLPTCEAISSIRGILNNHRVSKKYDTLIHSMVLMLYHSHMNGETTLVDIMPTEYTDLSEIGKEVIEKYKLNNKDIEFYYFMSGVIETEMENIRLDGVIPYQDKQTIRKLIDLFYFKELRNVTK